MKKQNKNKSSLKQLIVIAGLCLGLIAGIHVHSAVAVDTGGDSQDTSDTGDTGDSGDEDEAPSYANPAQAQHAANLAEAAASSPDEETEEALSAVEEAEAALAEAEEQNATPGEIAAAREDLAKAQEAYDDLVAEKTGVLSQEVAGMRNAGMGWGEIAQELGVHPGLLGLGHSKKGKGAYNEADMDEVTEATNRNSRSGWSKGHGVALGAGVASTSKTKGGYAFGNVDKGAKGKGQGGISGASGLGGGHGKGGSGSGGPGGGSGNGKGGVASNDGSPGNSGKGDKGGNSGKGNKGGNSGNGKGGGKGK